VSADNIRESGVVTAVSVIGFIFGIVSLLGSFIPCFGALAIIIAVPASIISAIAVWLAYSKQSQKTFAVAALTISLLALAISGFQYLSIKAIGRNPNRHIYKNVNHKVRYAPPSFGYIDRV
jgi:hypothetical protein